MQPPCRRLSTEFVSVNALGRYGWVSAGPDELPVCDNPELSAGQRCKTGRGVDRTQELPGWDAEGSYVPWLFQNALLLPGYLNQEPLPETEDFPLDSWAAFVAAIEDGRPVLDLLAARVTHLFLRP